jgi:hypothetical protein
VRPVPPVALKAAYAWPRTMGRAAFAARGLMRRARLLIERIRPDRSSPERTPPAEP